MNIADTLDYPKGATHYRIQYSKQGQGGTTTMFVKWYKKEADQWRRFYTDEDNDYPVWSFVRTEEVNPDTAPELFGELKKARKKKKVVDTKS